MVTFQQRDHNFVEKPMLITIFGRAIVIQGDPDTEINYCYPLIFMITSYKLALSQGLECAEDPIDPRSNFFDILSRASSVPL
jgi:hypothetical protein